MTQPDPFNPPAPHGASGTNGSHAPGPDWGQIQRLVTLGTLAGSIAHEFNNILTPVLSYAQLAQSSPDDRELVLKALRKAAEGAEKAAEIASAMLGLIRDGEGVTACVVTDAVRDAVSCLARPPQKDGVRMDIRIPPTLAVRMRPVALQQVILNLVLNALQSMQQGPGTIRIFETDRACSTWNIANTNGHHATNGKHAPANAEAPAHVVLAVSDSGCGIPAKDITRIFEPFRSVQRKKGHSGTGLGLAISKRLIEEAGGRIEVESVVGEGTTFFLTLPRATQAEFNASRAA